MSKVVEDRQEVIYRIGRMKTQLFALGVKRLALFGSFVRGDQHAESDVDLLVEFAPGRKSYDSFFAVGELLESALQRPVELLTPESLSPHIGPHILREATDVLAD